MKTMKKTFPTCHTPNPRTTYGGMIHSYDFYGRRTLSDVTKDILADLKFDETCRKNLENRNAQVEWRKNDGANFK